jgi:HlyD family secretion protein
VNLEIVRAERDSVLRIPNGPAIGRGRDHQVYVLTPRGPEPREIRTGLKSEEYIEIVSGLKAGERVVLSEISSPEELEELEIR